MVTVWLLPVTLPMLACWAAPGGSSSSASSEGAEEPDRLVSLGARGHAREIQWIAKLAAEVAAYFFHLSRSALLPWAGAAVGWVSFPIFGMSAMPRTIRNPT